MSRKQPWLDPININAQTWCYAEDKGLCIVRQIPALQHDEVFFLPWRSVGKAMRLRQQMKAARSPVLRRMRKA